MATIISKSPEETQAIGESWVTEVESGWVIGLTGDLGTGKTQLVKGLARAMGITKPVTSPTFTLVCEYEANLPLYHLDFYRLKDNTEIIKAGLEPYFSPTGVTVIEWADRWTGTHSGHYRHVALTQTAENERRIEYEDFSA